MGLNDPEMTRTDWSMIHKAIGDDQEAESAGALEQLARRYWPAVYAYIRSTGRDVHEAADLTQGFVCDVLLGRELFSTADQKRGRFRSLLVQSLRNYLRERHRNDHAACRAPEANGTSVSLHPQALSNMDVGTDRSPDEAFDLQWSATLVRRVLEQVRFGCINDGLELHWAVFEFRVVRPMLLGEPATPYHFLVKRLELDDSAQAANMMVTVKRRFARALHVEIARTVHDPQETDSELADLLTKLGAIVQPGESQFPDGTSRRGEVQS